MGNHWALSDMPFAVDNPRGDANRPSGAVDTVVVSSDGLDQRWFDSFSPGGPYVERGGGQDALTDTSIGASTVLRVTDPTGATTDFYDFSDANQSGNNAGQFLNHTDANGTVTRVTQTDGSGNIVDIQRGNPATSEVEQWQYAYATPVAGFPPAITNVQLQRSSDGGASFGTVEQAVYGYYDGSTSGGNPMDLASANVYYGADTTRPVSSTVYRYWKDGESGSVGGSPVSQPSGTIKMVFGTEAVARSRAAGYDPQTGDDGALAAYADNFFTYSLAVSPSGLPQVYSEAAAGAGGTPTGGLGTFTYSYTSLGGTPGYNAPSYKTLETLPDGGTNTVYTNFVGEVLLKVHADAGGANPSANGWEYDASGRTVMQAGPSAFTTAPADGNPLFLSDSDSGTSWYLTATGAEQWVSYFPTTNAAAGYEQYAWLQQGYADNQVPVTSLTASGTTATATLDGNPYRVGDVVVIAGADPAAYDGAFVVTAASATTFSFTLPSDPGGDATGGAVTADKPALQKAFTYYAQAAGGATTYPVASSTVYRNADQSGAETTAYAYTFAPGSLKMTSQAVSAPVVTAARNGPGTADVTTTAFDALGNARWVRDADGYLSYTARDPGTGSVTESIDDVNTSVTGDFSDLPPGWATPAGGGANLVTSYQIDGLGRVTREATPLENATPGNTTYTYTVYKDGYDLSTGFTGEVRTYPAFDTATGAATGPARITREFLPAPSSGGAVYVEALASSAAPATSGGVPTGAEAVASSDVQGLTRSITNDAGQAVEADRYFSLSGVPYSASTLRLGAADLDYYATTLGYGATGLADRVRAPTGTITDLTLDGLGRLTGVFVGTDDAGATDADPTGGGAAGNNMVRTEAEQYDNGGVGDSDLTQTTLFPGGSQAPRVTRAYYDWRDRPVADKSGVLLNGDGSENLSAEGDGTNRPIDFTTYDNLGERVVTDAYTGDGVAVTTSGGVVSAPDPSLLRAKTTTSYDDRGRPYRTQAFSVDPGSGAVGSALTSDTFYDHRGDAVATYAAGGGASKSVYDGAGRVVASYATDGGAVNNGGSPLLDWADASSVANDVVVSQTQSLYDGDGNVIQTVASDRLPGDAATAAGALGDHTGSGGPAARVSYAASYFDAADRPTATEDVGTNGGAPWSRPASPDARDDNHLVTGTTYDAMGLADAVTDPRGVVGKTFYDLLGRTTETIAAYTGGSPTSSTDQTTTYAYDGNGDVVSQTAVMPSGTPSQTTQYVYGVTVAGGSTINSNDLLAKVEYPDKASGNASPAASDAVSGTYDALGEPLTSTDQNGTTHALGYDLLGRQSSDAVTALGAGVDGTVQLHATSYNSQGQVYQMTAYGSPSGGAVLNQVQDVYNGLGQMTGQYQSHAGAVSAATPEVRYAYSDPSTGSRQSGLTYPNGRVLSIGYGGSALDSAIGRVDSLADAAGSSAGHLADYQYLRSRTVVSQADGNGVSLSYLQQPGDTQAVSDGGDSVTGLDRFGRVIDQNYVNTSTGASTDRFQYGYDRNGNVLYKSNLVNGSFSELYHANSTNSGDNNGGYDPLNRLTAFSRGALSAGGHNGSSGPGSLDTVSSPSHGQSWSLDALGNQSSVTTDGTARSETFNSKNQIATLTAGTSPTSTLGYDNAGDTTTDDKGRRLTYDAWGQLAAVKDASGNTLAAYTTDAAGRRITQAAGTGPATDLYYSGGNVVEERQGPTVTAQYVWGVTYATDLLLRDDNSTAGSLGVVGSGLGRRLYAQHDANYDATALTDASGNVVQRFAYDPYGAVTVLTPPWSAGTDLTGWAYLFQGMRLDPATGLYHTPNREYNPALGRWMQMDPGRYINGSSLYQFVGSAPLNWTDPRGLDLGGAHVDGWGPHVPAPAQIQVMQAQAKADTAAAGQTADAWTAARDGVAGFGDGFVPGYGWLRDQLGSEYAADPNSTAYAGWHAAGNVALTVASAGVSGTGIKGLDAALKTSRALQVGSRLAGGGFAVMGAAGVAKQAQLAASNWDCDPAKAVFQAIDASASAYQVFLGLKGLFGGWGGGNCFVAGTLVLMADDADGGQAQATGAADTAGAGGDDSEPRDWDLRYLQGAGACALVAAAGSYLLWDDRRRRFLAAAQEMLDAVEPLELPLYPDGRAPAL